MVQTAEVHTDAGDRLHTAAQAVGLGQLEVVGVHGQKKVRLPGGDPLGGQQDRPLEGRRGVIEEIPVGHVHQRGPCRAKACGGPAGEKGGQGGVGGDPGVAAALPSAGAAGPGRGSWQERTSSFQRGAKKYGPLPARAAAPGRRRPHGPPSRAGGTPADRDGENSRCGNSLDAVEQDPGLHDAPPSVDIVAPVIIFDTVGYFK